MRYSHRSSGSQHVGVTYHVLYVWLPPFTAALLELSRRSLLHCVVVFIHNEDRHTGPWPVSWIAMRHHYLYGNSLLNQHDHLKVVRAWVIRSCNSSRHLFCIYLNLQTGKICLSTFSIICNVFVFYHYYHPIIIDITNVGLQRRSPIKKERSNWFAMIGCHIQKCCRRKFNSGQNETFWLWKQEFWKYCTRLNVLEEF